MSPLSLQGFVPSKPSMNGMMPTHKERAISVTQFFNSNVNLCWEHPHRHTQKNAQPESWVSHDPVNQTHEINYKMSLKIFHMCSLYTCMRILFLKNSILTRTEMRENNVFAQSHTVHIMIFQCLYSKQDLFNKEIVQGIAAHSLLKTDKIWNQLE